MIVKFVLVLYADHNIIYFIEDSGDVIFSCNEIGILSVDPNNINLNDTSYDEDVHQTVIHVKIIAYYILKTQSTQQRNKPIFNACSVVSYNLVEFLNSRR